MPDDYDLPFQLPGFIRDRENWIRDHYPNEEPRFGAADAIPWLFHDAVRTYLIGSDAASLLCALATLEKSLARATGEGSRLTSILETANDQGLITDKEYHFLNTEARDWYNSDKHYRSSDHSENLESRTLQDTSGPENEEGPKWVSSTARLDEEARKSLEMMFKIIPRLEFVEMDGDPKPFEKFR